MKKQFLSFLSVLGTLAMGSWMNQAKTVDLSVLSQKDNTDYIVLVEGKDALTQEKVLSQIKYQLSADSYTITNQYHTVMNGFAISLKNGSDADKIKAISGVETMEIAHTYAAPEDVSGLTAGTDTSEINNTATMGLKLGNYSSETMRATDGEIQTALGKDNTFANAKGKGITIGIIDTGLYLNQVEGTTDRATAESEGATCEKDTTIKYTLNPAAFRATSDVTETLSQGALDTQFAEAGGKDYFTYVNNKIPFARNYADDTKDVTPGLAGEHGTHVASLAAANGKDFSGIAPNAQIAVLKVFSANSAGGAGEPAIIAALEDAAKLKLDIVNLSLGTDLTDFDDTISNSTFQAVQGASDAGVIVNYSAGNAGKSNFNSATGYADYTTSTVEPSMIGSSSLYDEKANIIAATTPEKAFYSSILLAYGEALSYSDQIIKRNVKGQQDVAVEHRITDLLGTENSKQIPFVRIPGLGTDSDFQQSMVNNSKNTTDANAKKTYLNGKVAVIDRGSCPFVEKIDNAMAYGAAGVIVINNLPGAVSMNMDISTDIDAIGGPNGIPVGFTALSSSTPLKGDADGNGEFQLAKNQVELAPDGNAYSDFTSNGSTYNLDFDPTISAPGSLIMGAIDAQTVGYESTNPTGSSYLSGYEYMSGTSMAAPNFTGALANALSQAKAGFGTGTAMHDTAFAAYKKNVSAMAMSTADQIHGYNDSTVAASPRLQGAGRVNVSRILSANAYVTSITLNDNTGEMNADDANTVNTNSQAKAELKNDGSLHQEDLSDATKEASIVIPYTIHNDSSEERTYTPTTSVMIPNLRIQYSSEDEAANKKNSVASQDKIPDGLKDKATVSTDDDKIADVPGTAVTVPANDTKDGTIEVRIDNISFTKKWNKHNADETMTLREYYNKYFSEAGGSFVEGYVTFNATGDASAKAKQLSLPYMGFYGDYTKGKIVEDFDFEKDTTKEVYTSDMIDAYMQGLNEQYKKKNAYSASAIVGAKAKVTDISKVGTFDTSISYNDTAYRNLVQPGDNNTLYAGAPGKSNFIVASFFVLRSASSATWTLKKKGSSTVTSSGNVTDAYFYSSLGGYMDFGDASMGLMKSWLVTQSSETNPYCLHRGIAQIDLNSVDEGEYTLDFTFTGRANTYTSSHTNWTNKETKQTKEYTVVVDKTAPIFSSAAVKTVDMGGVATDVIHTVFQNADFIADSGSIDDVELVDGSSDLYYDDLILTDAIKERGYVVLRGIDKAGNESRYLFHLDDSFSWGLGGDFFDTTTNYDFSGTYASGSDTSVIYSFQITKGSKAIKTFGSDYSGDFSVVFNVGAGLSKDDLEININSASANLTSSQFEYDATTGYVFIPLNLKTNKVSNGSLTIEINYAVVAPGNKPIAGADYDPSNPSGDDTSSSSSSSTGSASSSSSSDSSKDDSKKGLPGWGIALISVGSVAGLGGIGTLVVFLLKKHK